MTGQILAPPMIKLRLSTLIAVPSGRTMDRLTASAVLERRASAARNNITECARHSSLNSISETESDKVLNLDIPEMSCTWRRENTRCSPTRDEGPSLD